MNWLVGITVVTIGAAAFARRSPEPVPVQTGVEPKQPILAAMARAVPVEEPQPVEIAPPTVVGSVQASTPELIKNSEGEESALDRERIIVKLEAGLGLSLDQRRHFEVVLLEREGTIEAYHAEIRASRVLWTWGYEKRTREILASSQARMMAVLSPEQVRRFHELYDEGKVTEGISFEITPEMTVLR